MKQIDHDYDKLIDFVEKNEEFRCAVAWPGDVVVIRPLDHHAGITVYKDKDGFKEDDNFAMAIGRVFIRRKDVGDCIRYLKLNNPKI